MSLPISRRHFLVGAGSAATLALAACSGMSQRFDQIGTAGQQFGQQIGDQLSGLSAYATQPRVSDYYREMYGPRPNEKFPVPAVDLARLDPSYWRTDVADPTGEKPGTIVVSTADRYLYLVQEGGRAIRYGVGIGREGFEWSGRGEIGRKAEWPWWTPPPEMIRRQPELEEWRNGQPPGLMNPLGARAMYIYQKGRDSGYRLHGSPEWWSIGKAVSSGCVRLVNQDVIDLYGRVPVGTRVLVV
jgi:lipoprotein-anchoring transpeptidase ErfK/SrfK